MTDSRRAKARQDFDKLFCNSAVYDFAEANSIMEDFVLLAGRKNNNDCQRFSKLFARLAPQNSEIGFYPLNMLIAQRVSLYPEQKELFSDVRLKAVRPDTAFIINLSQDILEASCPRKGHISQQFLKNFENFITGQIKTYDFSRADINKLTHFFAESDCHHPEQENLYHSLPDIIRQAQAAKLDKEVAPLNNWAFQFHSDDLLKKLSFRSTYINLLYERLIRNCSIKHINCEQIYQQHRMMTAKKVKELTGTTDSKGKTICRKYAINKVYKAQASADNFKLDCLHAALEQDNLSSYAECKEILQALHGGKKSRNVRMPLRFLSYEH